ncbi:MAG: aminodeoxychorismate/anthranilate synthase component II [Dehalococcoidia bacterium]|jgi:anthranilate synthase component 2/para-aminobenzoate synthetase component 2
MVVLIIDNYDSFVFNLAQYVGQDGAEPAVSRNDAISIDDIEKMAPSHIIISPGPKSPLDAGISNDVVKSFAGKIPILGVCLGHQCIGHVYGGRIERTRPVHGKSSPIYHDSHTIYAGVENPFAAGRYHSLSIRPGTLPDSLVVSAATADGDIMGIRHNKFVVEGVQFHPESVLTPVGYDMIVRFLSISSPVWNETF